MLDWDDELGVADLVAVVPCAGAGLTMAHKHKGIREGNLREKNYAGEIRWLVPRKHHRVASTNQLDIFSKPGSMYSRNPKRTPAPNGPIKCLMPSHVAQWQ